MAFAKQDPDVSDVDALAFVKYNAFRVRTKEGKEIVTQQDMAAIMASLADVPMVPTYITPHTSIDVGTEVKVLTENAEVEGVVKDIRYVISGLGNKYYKPTEVIVK